MKPNVTTQQSNAQYSKATNNNTHHLTGESKRLEDLFADFNNRNKTEYRQGGYKLPESNQSVTEEFVVEISGHEGGEKNGETKSESKTFRSGKPLAEYQDDYFPLETENIDESEFMEQLKNQNFIPSDSNVADQEINDKNLGGTGTEEEINSMMQNVSSIDRTYDKATDVATFFHESKMNDMLSDLVKKFALDDINAKVDEYLRSDSNPLNSIPVQYPAISYSLPYLAAPQLGVRTILHHQGFPLEQLQLGK